MFLKLRPCFGNLSSTEKAFISGSSSGLADNSTSASDEDLFYWATRAVVDHFINVAGEELTLDGNEKQKQFDKTCSDLRGEQVNKASSDEVRNKTIEFFNECVAPFIPDEDT